MTSRTVESPIGTLLLTSDGEKITAIEVAKRAMKKNRDAVLERCEKELAEYFSGKRTEFSVEIEPHGTPFQKAVWKEMRKVGFGSTVSYKEIAQNIGRPKAMRAVGSACGKNPILLAVPCHRVLGSSGRLGGFSAGIEKKKVLLRHERLQ